MMVDKVKMFPAEVFVQNDAVHSYFFWELDGKGKSLGNLSIAKMYFVRSRLYLWLLFTHVHI